jgi:transposase
MELTPEQFGQIEQYLPRQRGNVSHKNLAVINAILYLAENDCKWWALPKRFGKWNTIYTRVNRWAKAGVLDRVFEQMQRLGVIRIKLEVTGIDGAVREDRPDDIRVPRKAKRQSPTDLAAGPPKFIWVPRVRVCHRAHALARTGRRPAARLPMVVSLGALMTERLLSNYGSGARRR